MIKIIGGGIAGCTTALELSDTYSIELYEKNTLLNNSHYCHLHLGLLYPKSNVIEFTKDSLLFMKEFPDCILYRPTIITYSYNSTLDTKDLISDCNTIENYLNDGNFYKSYSLEDLLRIFRSTSDRTSENYFDQYIRNTFKYIDRKVLEMIKFPIVCAKEYGIDSHAVNKTISERILSNKNIFFRNIFFRNNFSRNNFSRNNAFSDNLIIYATGHHNKELVEKKANFTLLVDLPENIAEFVIIGERGTEDGMLQITPISSKECIVHKMSNRGSLQDFDEEYIIKEFNKVFSFPVKNIKTNIGFQEVHQDLLNRNSTFTINENCIHIKLLKAISSVRISKEIKQILI